MRLRLAHERSLIGTLNVLLWSPKGAGLHYGGPGRAAYTLYKALGSRGVVASLAHGWHEQPADDPLFVSTHLVAPISSSRVTQAKFVHTAKRWLMSRVRDYDVLHGIGGYHLTTGPAVYSQRAGLPAVVKLAMHRGELVRKPGLAGLLGLGVHRRNMIRELSAIIAISSEIADEVLSYGVPHSKIVRIPNGVDTQRFRPIPPSERSIVRNSLQVRDLPTILFVGALTRRKRPHLILNAVGALHRAGIDVQVLFVGPSADAAYHASLCNLVEVNELQDVVTFVGFVPDPSPYFQAADIFVLPSMQEGLPNALAEAMASGLAVVASPASGVGDLIENTTSGIICESEQSFEPVLRELLSSASARQEMGRAARRSIEASFSLNAVADAHVTLFEAL